MASLYKSSSHSYPVQDPSNKDVECAYPSPSSDGERARSRRLSPAPLSVPHEPQCPPRREPTQRAAELQRPLKLKGSPRPEGMHPPFSPPAPMHHDLDAELVSDPLIEHLIRGVEVWRDNSIRTIEARASAYLQRLGGIRSDPNLVARLHLARRKMQLNTGPGKKRSVSVPARRRQGSAESQRVLEPPRTNEADQNRNQMDVEKAAKRARRMSA